jgi:hypothetical protein
VYSTLSYTYVRFLILISYLIAECTVMDLLKSTRVSYNVLHILYNLHVIENK